MSPQRLFDIFRADAADEAEPFLWSNDEIWEYMDEAQKMFCRRAGGIADSRSDITQLAVTAGDIWTDISPRILKIRSVMRLSDYQPISILNIEDIPAPSIQNDYGVPKALRLDASTGPLQSMIVGMEANAVRWSPIASADDTVALVVYRLPLSDIDADSVALDDVEFEIDEQHHRSLIKWMKHLAYGKQDAETFDQVKSAESEADFLNYCAQAKAERERREHKPRTVAYGGI